MLDLEAAVMNAERIRPALAFHGSEELVLEAAVNDARREVSLLPRSLREIWTNRLWLLARCFRPSLRLSEEHGSILPEPCNDVVRVRC
jgi:hypothetical protein